jgi:hypothetical protein
MTLISIAAKFRSECIAAIWANCDRSITAANSVGSTPATTVQQRKGITMQKTIRSLTALLILGLAASIANAAESKAVQTMAGILANLQHFPSAADKETLKGIAEDKAATANERTLATALSNVQHMAAAGDKPALEAIVADAKATNGAKTLASIILNVKHFPSADDKEKLKALGQ